MIGFVVIAGALTLLSLLAVIAPLWRGRPNRADGADLDTDMAIYKDQLTEVDRDLDRGVLEADEADRARVEISRRLLAADASRRRFSIADDKANRRSAIIIFSSIFLLTVLGYFGSSGVLRLIGLTEEKVAQLDDASSIEFTLGGMTLAVRPVFDGYGSPGYGDVPRSERIASADLRRETRVSQAEAEAALTIPDTLDAFDADTRSLIQTRRAAAFEAPLDVRVWDVLARSEAAIGQYQRAARAMEQVVALKGDAVPTEDLEMLLDLMVAGVQSYVSPEAEAVTLRVLQRDPNSIPGLYYAGLLYAQNDRPDRAFPLWRRVVEGGQPGTLHWDFAAGQIEQVAGQLGVDYTLPDRRGPSPADIEAAQVLALEDRMAMIGGMVNQLSSRLANEGGPPGDWAQLIRSLAVLGELDQARAILSEAELTFGGDVQAVTLIRRAAQEVGLIQ